MLLEILLASAVSIASCEERAFPDQRSKQDCAEVTHSASYVRCSFGSSELTEAVNKYVEEWVTDNAFRDAGIDDTMEEYPCDADFPYVPESVEASCDEPFVIGPLISIACSTFASTGAHPDGSRTALNLRVTGDTFVRIAISDLFVTPDAESRFWTLVRNDLRCQLEEFGGDPAREKPQEVEELLNDANRSWSSFSFGKDGLMVTYSHYVFGYSVLDTTVSYEDLEGLIHPELAQPNFALQPTPQAPASGSIRETGSARLRSG